MTRGRIAAGIAAVAIAAGGLLAVNATGILSGDVCVTQYESPGPSGDSLTTCSTTPSNVKISNLATHTEGLTNGCQRAQNQSSSWNDCISAARIGALPTNQKVVWYRDSSYVSQVACVDGNGSYDVAFGSGAIDVISSFRILGGNC